MISRQDQSPHLLRELIAHNWIIENINGLASVYHALELRQVILLTEFYQLLFSVSLPLIKLRVASIVVELHVCVFSLSGSQALIRGSPGYGCTMPSNSGLLYDAVAQRRTLPWIWLGQAAVSL